jgi:hypothetical protein
VNHGRWLLWNTRRSGALSELMAAIESLRGLIVIDEVQRHPALFN